MDERSEYEEIIKENLDYDILCQDPKFDKDRFREIMDIMLDAVCFYRSDHPYQRRGYAAASSQIPLPQAE